MVFFSTIEFHFTLECYGVVFCNRISFYFLFLILKFKGRLITSHSYTHYEVTNSTLVHLNR